jgi:hypothetical protein
MKGARNCASLVRRPSQRSSLHAVAECSLAKIIGSKPEMGSLIGSVLSIQSFDFKLKPRNSTLPTFGPTLKGLRFLEAL